MQIFSECVCVYLEDAPKWCCVFQKHDRLVPVFYLHVTPKHFSAPELQACEASLLETETVTGLHQVTSNEYFV
jgi:hypothetical protein